MIDFHDFFWVPLIFFTLFDLLFLFFFQKDLVQIQSPAQEREEGLCAADLFFYYGLKYFNLSFIVSFGLQVQV